MLLLSPFTSRSEVSIVLLSLPMEVVRTIRPSGRKRVVERDLPPVAPIPMLAAISDLLRCWLSELSSLSCEDVRSLIRRDVAAIIRRTAGEPDDEVKDDEVEAA